MYYLMHYVWRHGQLGQINNFTSKIRGKWKQSAHLIRHYSCSWTKRPAIQEVNRRNTKRISKNALPHCTRDPRIVGSEAPPQCWRWISTHRLKNCHPISQRTKVFRSLHSAHQGKVGMKARTNESFYCPGMNVSIRNKRAGCICCTKIAPSPRKEPIILTPSPDWPFQQIVMDLFHVENHG